MLSFAVTPIAEKVRRRVRRHGLPAALHAYGMRALNLVITFRILRALYLERSNPAFCSLPAGYAAGFASREELQRFAQQPASDLSLEFVDQALGHGDQCLVLRDGGNIAAYSWYSFRPTPMGVPGALLHFDPHWVYRYKDYTLPDYRGRRLHAISTALGLAHYRSRGFLGCVAYVESSNFDSLKSCFRAGHQPFGAICVLQMFNRVLVLPSRGCARLGFRLRCYCLSPFGKP
jgi:hypothetical protein